MTLAGFVAGWFSGSSGGAVGMTCASAGLTFFAFAAGFGSRCSAVLTGAGGLTGFSFAASLYGCSGRSFGNCHRSGLGRSLTEAGLVSALCRLDFITRSIYVLCLGGGYCTENQGYEKQFLHDDFF